MTEPLQPTSLELEVVTLDNAGDLDTEDGEQPVPSTPREELEQAILDGGGRLADVYQLRVVDGKPAARVAAELGLSGPGFVSNYEAFVKLILDGVLPAGPTLLDQSAAAARGLRRKAQGLSPAGLQLLNQHIAKAETALAATHPAVSGSGSGLSAVPGTADPIADAYATGTVNLSKSGIYAFTIGRYRADQGKSVIKVGMAQDISKRMAEHRRNAKTVMPDPIELLRAWETPNHQAAEKTLHHILRLADQGYSRPGAGTEWFETTVDLLDELAKLMDLKLLT